MTRRGWWIAGTVAVVLVAGVVIWLRMSGTPLNEAAELLSRGGEKVLREPPRPARGTTRMLLVALDGVGDEALRTAIADGSAPRIAGLLGGETGDAGVFENGYAVPGVLSVLPSITVAAWTALFTGEPAARNGVPGNEWFAREEMRFYAPAPVSVKGNEHALEVYSDGLLGGVIRVPTVFETLGLRSHVSLGHVHRGADLLTVPEPSVIGDLVAAAAAGVVADAEVDREAYAALDRTAVSSLMESLDEHGVPDLQVVYFPGIDLYTHVAERPLEEQRRYLREVVDSAVGNVLDAYDRRGVLDDTYVVIVSDHGHTPVLADDRHALGVEGPNEPPELLRQAGFRLRPFAIDSADGSQDYQATVAYQGAFAYVYLADRSTCPEPGQRCDWRRPPRLEQDVLPVVRALDGANRNGEGVPALRGTIDLVFARAGSPVDVDAPPFEVWDGRGLVPVAEYLAANPRPDLLALESRLDGLAAGPFGHRAGDVLVLARSGMERPIEERYYFSREYRSWHSSPTAQDSRIPLIVAKRGMRGDSVRSAVERAVGGAPDQLDLAALVTALLAAADPSAPPDRR